MSGGSFNYLCHKNLTDVLVSGMEDLHDMAEALDGLGHYAKAPAERTAALYERISLLRQEVDEEIQSLSPVWHALEWWRSCDWGADQFWKSVGAWEARNAEAVAFTTQERPS